MNKLEVIFDKQKELQERLGYNFEGMNEVERTQYMKENIWYTITELDEAFREMPYGKPWKSYESFNRTVHNENLKEELIDALHFFMNILIAAGLTPKDIYDIYCYKNKINHKRQDENYGQAEE